MLLLPIEDEELYDIIADKFNELFLSEMDKMGLLDEENFLNLRKINH